MNLLILVVDDEPDVEVLFRQQFRRDHQVFQNGVAVSIGGRSHVSAGIPSMRRMRMRAGAGGCSQHALSFRSDL